MPSAQKVIINNIIFYLFPWGERNNNKKKFDSKQGSH